jgi:hypothetical protein
MGELSGLASSMKNPLYVTLALVLLTSLLANGILVYAFYASPQHNRLHFGRETVTVYRDGKFVSQNDNVVMNLMLDYLVCKMWNDSSACTRAGAFYGGTAPLCNKNVSPFNFYSNAQCSTYGIGVSTETFTPTSSNFACTQLTANGFAVQKGTTSYSIDTNSISFTTTFTASGTQNGIDKACLFPWNDRTNAAVTAGSPGQALAQDLFTSQNFINAQTLTITWTFTLT